MIVVDKHVGETPLELLERIRREKPELKDETLSYAGRLDPMAEGQMLILVGPAENNSRERFLAFDKEYVATFLIGVETDSGDCLGFIQDPNKKGHFSPGVEISKTDIEKQIRKLTEIKEQKYPWFSGKTVNGIKLFDHFRAGNTNIERPSRKVEIKEIELVNFRKESSREIKKYIFDMISKVSGDFRQKEILAKWETFFDSTSQTLYTFEIKIHVSSGTYIRALTENFDFPNILLKLKRTKI